MKLLTPPNVFLESQELTRLIRFIFENGFEAYLKHSGISFGIIPNESGDTSYFRCSVDSSLNLTLKLEDGLAFDSDGRLLVGKSISDIAIPTFDDWYWVKIKYKENTLEEGTLSVSATGAVVGTGTKFTEVLRGVASGHPSKIRLYNSTGTALAPLNGTRDYQIYSVANDTVLEINAVDLQNENNLRYSVVGTFTEGTTQTPDEQEIFRYDSTEVLLVQETTLNTKPAYDVGENEGNTFWIARVRKVSPITVLVQDKRELFWRSIASFNISNQDTTENLVIGVENVKFQGIYTPQTSNNVTVGWGLRTSDWSFNANTLEITLLSATGGNVKNISQLNGQNRDFSGWRLYVEGSNNYFKVVSNSYPTTTSLALKLDIGDPDNFLIGSQVFLVPNTDFVEIIAKAQNGDNLEKGRFLFPVRDSFAIIDLQVNGATYDYVFSYRYKNHFSYTIERLLPDATSVGYATQYYDELQFGADGNLVALPTYTTYTLGVISLKLSETAYTVLIGNLQTGEKRGVDYTSIDNGVPFRDIIVGTNKQYQVFQGAPVALSAVNYLNLKTTDANNNPIKEGATFYFHFEQGITLNTFDIRIKQNASILNPNGTGVLILELTDFDAYSSSTTDGLILKFVFDGSNWIYKRFHNIETTDWIPLTLKTNWINGSVLVSGQDDLHYRVFGESLQFKGEVYTTNPLPITPEIATIPTAEHIPSVARRFFGIIKAGGAFFQYQITIQLDGDISIDMNNLAGSVTDTNTPVFFDNISVPL